MKVMITAFIFALVVAYAAPEVLESFGWSTTEQGISSDNVRLD